MIENDTNSHPQDNLKDRARREYDDARARLHDRADHLRKDGPSTLKHTITDELDRRKHGFSAELRTLADTLKHAADEQNEKDGDGLGAAPAGLMARSAHIVEDLSDSLESRSVEDLGAAVSDYARANPAIFVGGCVIAGLALGRLLTASSRNATRSSYPTSSGSATPYDPTPAYNPTPSYDPSPAYNPVPRSTTPTTPASATPVVKEPVAAPAVVTEPAVSRSPLTGDDNGKL